MPVQEFKVAQRDDLAPGEMQQIKAGDTEILLARHQDEFYATAAHCTHYGAPLAEGALNGKRVVCPWHHACFDVSTGKQMEPPGCDSLPSFKVSLRDNDIYVKVPDDSPAMRMVDMQKPDAANKDLYVIIGGGAAGQYAAEALRAEGYRGRIMIISKDKDYPYDRVNCSKEYLQGEAPEEWMPLRDPGFYETYGIELKMETTVSVLDADAQMIRLETGEQLQYDKVLICTGGAVIKPDIEGASLDNIYTLRSQEDSSHIQKAGKQANKVVVMGSSFIGMEGAWSLAKLGCKVTVVSPEELPFAEKWGREVGEMFKELHEENGIEFRLGRKVSRFTGDKQVGQVELDNGDTLDADLVLVGIGVKPTTDFVKGLPLAADGGIRVDANLYAGKQVYAAGDVAHFPYKSEDARIEHWRLACQHGRLAGENMSGKAKPYESVPFFWTAQHGLQIRYVGYTPDYDRMLVDGDIKQRKFIAYYIKDGMVKAALGIGRDKEMAALNELIRMDRVPPVKDLEKHQIDLVQHLRALNGIV